MNVKSFKSNNTTGYDMMSSKIIQYQLYVLNPILTHIYNTSIINNEYPSPLKLMKIIPALKKDKDINHPDSYRDINMSNIIAKIFDKLMYNDIMKYLNENKILSNLHMGGINGSSAINAVEEIHEKLKKSR